MTLAKALEPFALVLPDGVRAPLCDYCHRPAVLVDSEAVYERSYGPIWICWKCQAWVGVHENSPRYQPLGRLANRRLRMAKSAAHAALDPLWKRGLMTRKGAYAWLAEQMNLPVKRTHIGWFDEAQCQRVIDHVKAYRARLNGV